MRSILRIAPELGHDELYGLSRATGSATVVLGNVDQPVPSGAVISRQVSPARLANMAKACARLKPYSEVRISGDAGLANSIFGDRSVRSRQNTWVIRATDAATIQSQLTGLDLSNVDRILTTSRLAKSIVERRTPDDVVVEFLRFGTPVEKAANVKPRRLVWVGTADPGEGVKDFLRIAALTELPVVLWWTKIPEPAEFTDVAASIGALGLEKRIRFAGLGSFDEFAGFVTKGANAGDLWICTARDYPARSGFELALQLGASLISFDSMYARELAEGFPENVKTVPEGGVKTAANLVRRAYGGSQ